MIIVLNMFTAGAAVLGCSANKALITGMNLVVSAFLIALQARLWVPAVNI